MVQSKAFYDSETKAAIGVFEGFLSNDEFKEIAEELHEIRRKNYSSKQINNVVNMKVLSQETQDWIKNSWFPKAKLTGLKHFAFVVPKDIFGKMSMEAVNSVVNDITIQYFDDENRAKAWLKSI
jgi:hypothetical protein